MGSGLRGNDGAPAGAGNDDARLTRVRGDAKGSRLRGNDRAPAGAAMTVPRLPRRQVADAPTADVADRTAPEEAVAAERQQSRRAHVACVG